MVAMYTYIVDRTQIYLTPEESAALERASIETGKTRSQLVREAIDEKYGSRRSLEEFLAASTQHSAPGRRSPVRTGRPTSRIFGGPTWPSSGISSACGGSEPTEDG